MKRLNILITGLWVAVGAFTTMDAQVGTLAAGGDFVGTAGFISFSVGQVTYTHITGEAGKINYGVQQPYPGTMVATEEPDLLSSAVLFPNPVRTVTYLQIEDNLFNQPGSLSYALYDNHGQLIDEQKINGTMTSIPVAHLANAFYVLQLRHNDSEIKTFKFFKTN